MTSLFMRTRVSASARTGTPHIAVGRNPLLESQLEQRRPRPGISAAVGVVQFDQQVAALGQRIRGRSEEQVALRALDVDLAEVNPVQELAAGDDVVEGEDGDPLRLRVHRCGMIDAFGHAAEPECLLDLSSRRPHGRVQDEVLPAQVGADVERQARAGVRIHLDAHEPLEGVAHRTKQQRESPAVGPQIEHRQALRQIDLREKRLIDPIDQAQSGPDLILAAMIDKDPILAEPVDRQPRASANDAIEEYLRRVVEMAVVPEGAKPIHMRQLTSRGWQEILLIKQHGCVDGKSRRASVAAASAIGTGHQPCHSQAILSDGAAAADGHTTEDLALGAFAIEFDEGPRRASEVDGIEAHAGHRDLVLTGQEQPGTAAVTLDLKADVAAVAGHGGPLDDEVSR